MKTTISIVEPGREDVIADVVEFVMVVRRRVGDSARRDKLEVIGKASNEFVGQATLALLNRALNAYAPEEEDYA